MLPTSVAQVNIKARKVYLRTPKSMKLEKTVPDVASLNPARYICEPCKHEIGTLNPFPHITPISPMTGLGFRGSLNPKP